MAVALALGSVWALAATTPLRAQRADGDTGFRIGIAFGGISTVSVVGEYFDGPYTGEVAIGTWAFRDVSISVVGKAYVGSNDVRPYVGAGLWGVVAAGSAEGERTGVALVLRAPLGAEWGFLDRHAVGAGLSMNRALWVLRSDPDDDLPLNRRLVPLPEVYYRFTP